MTAYERYLINYLLFPTARKIIKELIDESLISCQASPFDKRIELLTALETNYDKYI